MAHPKSTPVERTCEHCGASFTVSHQRSRRRFCSGRCSSTHTAETRWRGHAETRSCLQCGREFRTAISQNQVYCSHACKVESQRKHVPTDADVDRFWSFVDRSGGPDACWEWQGSQHPDGYGKIGWPGRKSPSISSRVAFEIANGRPPVGMVRHICDNPPCCNPAHLLEGTQLDNMRDAARRGRTACGSRNGMAILTEDQVREIRRTYIPRTNEWGAHALARKYGVSTATITNIAARKSWKHVE